MDPHLSPPYQPPFPTPIKGRVTSKMKLSDKVKWTLKSTSSSMNCQKNVNFYVRKSILCQIFSQSCYSICWLFLTVHSHICRVLPMVRVTQIAVGEFIFTVGTYEENTTYGGRTSVENSVIFMFYILWTIKQWNLEDLLIFLDVRI